MFARAFVLAAMLVVALTADSVGAPANPSAATIVGPSCRITAAENNRAVAIFQRLLPVLQSPRCANCHGAMDVSSPNTDHEGGRIDLVEAQKPDSDGRRFSECQDCHSRAAEEVAKHIAESEAAGRPLSPAAIRERYNAGHWRPVAIAKWGVMQPRQLCRAIKPSVLSGANMLAHLRDDVLIGLAFEGKRGQDYLDPQPPPMSRAEFIGVFQEWMAAMNARASWQVSPDCGCVEVSLPAVATGPTGNWETSEGTMMLTQFGAIVRGTYSQDNGRIDGTMQGNVLTGFWAEDGSAMQCATTRLNSRYWGRISWVFDKDKFTGTWDYCDQPLNGRWTGTRK